MKGGGNIFAGGGGGYIKVLFDTTPTSVISLGVGDGGSGGNKTTNGKNGTQSFFIVIYSYYSLLNYFFKITT